MNNRYPTDYELRKIRTWDYRKGFGPLMDYIKSIWWAADWGWRQRGRTYSISTGGWSGNEDIIGAMNANRMFWTCCWVSSGRGGHFRFLIPKDLVGPCEWPTDAMLAAAAGEGNLND